MWQRIAVMPDGTRILVTIYDEEEPDTIEVCLRYPFGDRWLPPLPIEVPPL